MHREVIMAGFGGQGLMSIGKLLALAGLEEGKEVTWLPSYGPEMRGGTANCTVVVSDKPIGSPLIPSPMGAIVMNRPSHEKFAPALKKGGILVVNSSLIPDRSPRKDITSFRIQANEIALELGSGRSANLVVLGAYLGLDEIVSSNSIINAIKKAFARKKKFIDVNCQCFLRGYEEAKAGKNDE
jgi:2-oxoglutarate ferredoxin oxidoreductase subunit gamma